MLCSFNCSTKIVWDIFRKQMMVQETARISETCMLYLSKAVTNHVIFRRCLYSLINLIFVYVFDSLISDGNSFHNLILYGINELQYNCFLVRGCCIFVASRKL